MLNREEAKRLIEKTMPKGNSAMDICLREALKMACDALDERMTWIPCKPGDTIYTIYHDDTLRIIGMDYGINKGVVESIVINEHCSYLLTKDNIRVYFNEWNKISFLTKEAAEVALKKMKEDK